MSLAALAAGRARICRILLRIPRGGATERRQWSATCISICWQSRRPTPTSCRSAPSHCGRSRWRRRDEVTAGRVGRVCGRTAAVCGVGRRSRGARRNEKLHTPHHHAGLLQRRGRGVPRSRHATPDNADDRGAGGRCRTGGAARRGRARATLHDPAQLHDDARGGAGGAARPGSFYEARGGGRAAAPRDAPRRHPYGGAGPGRP